MKIKAALSALLLLILNCAALARDAHPQGAKPQIIAFVGVNVVPMDRERVIENQTVIVRGDRIAEIGPAAKIKVPADALRVEARGKYLMPGLAEMHGHLPHPNQQLHRRDLSHWEQPPFRSDPILVRRWEGLW